MSLTDAAQHLGAPVLAHDPPRNAHGRIESINPGSGMVGVRVNRHRFPYDPLKTLQWWHPARLTLKGTT